MKKILLCILFSFLLISQTFANFGIISHDYFFFENNQTKEVKYVHTRTYQSKFVFNHFLLNYIEKSEIGGTQKLQNWKLLRLERKTNDLNTQSETAYYFLTGTINTAAYGNNIGSRGFTGTLSNISSMDTLGFDDLTREENMKLFVNIFYTFFSPFFLIFLAINILVFFCFGYLFFLLYEKFGWKLFKDVYINSFFVYVLYYILEIQSGFSLIDLTYSQLFGFMAYLFYVGWIKLILLLISNYVREKYNKKYPQNKLNYQIVGYFYGILFVLFFLIMQMKVTYQF